jgi:hypothetical protein
MHKMTARTSKGSCSKRDDDVCRSVAGNTTRSIEAIKCMPALTSAVARFLLIRLLLAQPVSAPSHPSADQDGTPPAPTTGDEIKKLVSSTPSAMEEPPRAASLYNRQIYAIGFDTQQQLAQAHVLLVGLGPCGVEVAKNIILMGVGSVTLCDGTPLEAQECGYFARGLQAGGGRAAQLAAPLQALNPYVKLQVADALPSLPSSFTAVVVTGACLNMTQWIEMDAHCRTARIPFIAVGMTAKHVFVFSDFGEAHQVVDPDGTRPLVCEWCCFLSLWSRRKARAGRVFCGVS